MKDDDTGFRCVVAADVMDELLRGRDCPRSSDPTVAPRGPGNGNAHSTADGALRIGSATAVVISVVGVDQTWQRIFLRSRSNLARPYMPRLIDFRRDTTP